MINRVVVTIDGAPYTVVAEESEEYIRKNAALVDKTIADIKASSPFSTLQAAVLAGMNIADKYYKSVAASDEMRRQINDYSKECAELRAQLAKLGKR